MDGLYAISPRIKYVRTVTDRRIEVSSFYNTKRTLKRHRSYKERFMWSCPTLAQSSRNQQIPLAQQSHLLIGISRI